MKNDIRTLDLLKALDALLDERGVTHAAKGLSLKQPTANSILIGLRDCFGFFEGLRHEKNVY